MVLHQVVCIPEQVICLVLTDMSLFFFIFFSSFNFTFRYADNVLINNYKFGDYVDHIFFIDLKIIEDATDTARSVSYPDLHLVIDSEGQLRMKLYDKSHDFNFQLCTFHLYAAIFHQYL